MYAKQYEITLPADYDMGIIRKRVADGGHVLDDRAGLGLKAYVLRERGVAGSPVNQYAPFYLWNDTGAMAQFLVGGGGFQNIVRDFGRPVVHHWTGIACHAGAARARALAPRTASRRRTPIPVDPDTDGTGLGLAALVEREAERLRALARREDVHTAALAFDPYHWELMRFVLWSGPVPEGGGDGGDGGGGEGCGDSDAGRRYGDVGAGADAGGGTGTGGTGTGTGTDVRYELLHLSAPGLGALGALAALGAPDGQSDQGGPCEQGDQSGPGGLPEGRAW